MKLAPNMACDTNQQGCRTVGQDCQKCKETSSPLADKQQKTGERVKNIRFSVRS